MVDLSYMFSHLYVAALFNGLNSVMLESKLEHSCVYHTCRAVGRCCLQVLFANVMRSFYLTWLGQI